MTGTKYIHIVIGGRREEHIPIGLSILESDSVHVITSVDFEDKYQKSLDKWENDLGIERGLLIAIPTTDLFSESVVSIIRDAMRKICEEEGSQFPLLDGDGSKWVNGMEKRFMVNITGGTNLMGGSAVHAAGMIGATCYYVREGEGDGRVMIFPTMGTISLLSQYRSLPMRELLEKPTGIIDELEEGAELVLDLCIRGLASIQEEGAHYEITEEAKRALFQTIQNRLGDGGENHNNRELKKAQLGSKKDEGNKEFSFAIVSFSSEKCSHRVYRVFMENENIEARAEIWEGEDGMRLRMYFANPSEPDGGESWDKKNGRKVRRFSESWFSEDEVLNWVLRLQLEDKGADQIARVVSSGTELERFSLMARIHLRRLGFEVPGSLSGPVKD